uniref:Uncharacterized protein n=1 Tax=Anguilla anguilla TaxID=7936 RepID=A0A0E9VN86_ANGAN
MNKSEEIIRFKIPLFERKAMLGSGN